MVFDGPYNGELLKIINLNAAIGKSNGQNGISELDRTDVSVKYLGHLVDISGSVNVSFIIEGNGHGSFIMPVHKIQVKVILDVRHIKNLDRTENIFVLTQICVP
jgi:thiamine biosynthesis protein ThiC